MAGEEIRKRLKLPVMLERVKASHPDMRTMSHDFVVLGVNDDEAMAEGGERFKISGLKGTILTVNRDKWRVTSIGEPELA
jgi:hypothetical protein